MRLLRFFSLLFLSAVGVQSVDNVGSSGCTAPACVFANNNLRFGTGTQTSVNTQGLFVQPFYYSQSANTWYKLTYSTYPLDTAIGTGTGGPNWSGTTVMDLYSAPISGSFTDYSEFIVSESDTSKSVGYGKITAIRNITINGQLVTFQNQFSLGQTDNFVQITTRVTNIHTAPIQNMLIWVGTRDDYVGTTDVNIKTRGNLVNGQFEAVTANNQTSYAIMITNSNEGVLFYSETVGVMTAYSSCCAFANAYNTNPTSIPPATPTGTDGSYAAVLPIGTLAVGDSSSIVWYYAAGAISSLNSVVETVAEAQQAQASPSETPSVLPTVTITPTISSSASMTASMSVSMTSTTSESSTPSITASASSSISPTSSISATTSSTSSDSSTPSSTATSSSSISPTASTTASISASTSPTASMTSSISSTSSSSRSVTASVSSSITPSASMSVSVHATTSGSPTKTASSSATVSPTPSPSDIVILQMNFQQCAMDRSSLISEKQMCMIEKQVCLNQTVTTNVEKQNVLLHVQDLELYQRWILGVLLAVAGLSLCVNMCICVYCCRKRQRSVRKHTLPTVDSKKDIYAL
jgi:hypothetical protein